MDPQRRSATSSKNIVGTSSNGSRRKSALIIGSGFGGLALGIRLQSLGIDTTILEQLDAPGGRAYVRRADGFTFDMGPTVLTVPHFIEELFALEPGAAGCAHPIFRRTSLRENGLPAARARGRQHRAISTSSPFRRFTASISTTGRPLITTATPTARALKWRQSHRAKSRRTSAFTKPAKRSSDAASSSLATLTSAACSRCWRSHRIYFAWGRCSRSTASFPNISATRSARDVQLRAAADWRKSAQSSRDLCHDPFRGKDVGRALCARWHGFAGERLRDEVRRTRRHDTLQRAVKRIGVVARGGKPAAEGVTLRTARPCAPTS